MSDQLNSDMHAYHNHVELPYQYGFLDLLFPAVHGPKILCTIQTKFTFQLYVWLYSSWKFHANFAVLNSLVLVDVAIPVRRLYTLSAHKHSTAASKHKLLLVFPTYAGV